MLSKAAMVLGLVHGRDALFVEEGHVEVIVW